jgi:hypothetical protein
VLVARRDILRRDLGRKRGEAEGEGRRSIAEADAFDPTATLAVHCGNSFDTGVAPYQSTRLSR